MEMQVQSEVQGGGFIFCGIPQKMKANDESSIESKDCF